MRSLALSPTIREIQVSTIRKALFATAFCLISAVPVSAQNQVPAGAAAGTPRAADGTLGMALMGASVTGTGTLTRGSGVTAANRIGVSTGEYTVFFDRDITDCIYTATIGPGGGGAAVGQISVAQRLLTENGVYVATQDSAGAQADRPFHLTVFCPK
jgi:hypothetical protein